MVRLCICQTNALYNVETTTLNIYEANDEHQVVLGRWKMFEELVFDNQK